MELLSAPPLHLPKTFEAVDAAIDANADIADAVLAIGLDTYGIDPDSAAWKGAATPNDMDKVRSTIRQLYRDWSAEGADERKACFEPMLNALNNAFGATSPSQRCHLNVLVPGAGLGRLVLEVCRAGYAVEGNEISYHQLLVSNWVLNHARETGIGELYPWALSFSNHRARSNQMQKVLIPDVVAGQALNAASQEMASELHAFQRMSMSSGDFCVLYKEAEHAASVDAVLTCFFIDTAPNLISYIETVKSCLKPGGIWINLGPLLWHFESGGKRDEQTKNRSARGDLPGDRGIGEAGSFEITDEEVIHLLVQQGFEIAHHDNTTHAAGYIQDADSMLQNTYRPSFWVAKKT